MRCPAWADKTVKEGGSDDTTCRILSGDTSYFVFLFRRRLIWFDLCTLSIYSLKLT